MKRFRSVFVAWLLIITMLARPTPAEAAVPLAVVAVGAAIAASGVLVAGAGVYKPPTFAQANAVADAVTGDITRKVVVARAIGSGVNQVMMGYSDQLKVDFGKLYDWVKANLPDYPTLAPAIQSATRPVPITATPAVNDTFAGTTGTRKILTVGTPARTGGFYAEPGEYIFDALKRAFPTFTGDIGGERITNTTYTTMVYGPYEDGYVNPTNGRRLCYATQVTITTTSTTLPLNPYPDTQEYPPGFAPAYPQTQAAQDETDKAITDNPGIVSQPPAALTPEQWTQAGQEAEAVALEGAATTAEGLAAANPSDPSLAIAAANARAAANAARAKADAAAGAVESTPTEETPPLEVTPPGAAPAPDADVAIDLSPLLGIQDKALSKFPFSLVASLAGIYSGLTAAPVTPYFMVPMPWNIPSIKCDLSKWDGFAEKWRLMLAMFFHASCIYAIVRRYT